MLHFTSIVWINHCESTGNIIAAVVLQVNAVPILILQNYKILYTWSILVLKSSCFYMHVETHCFYLLVEIPAGPDSAMNNNIQPRRKQRSILYSHVTSIQLVFLKIQPKYPELWKTHTLKHDLSARMPTLLL